MVVGVIAAVLSALAYGTASVLQAHGAQSVADTSGETADGSASSVPSLRSTIAAILTVSFLSGMALDLIGFGGTLVSARLLPLFLAQPIMSANLVVTAVLAVIVLGAHLSRRDIVAIAVVVVSLVLLALTAGTEGHRQPGWLHPGVLIAAVVIIALGVGSGRVFGHRIALVAALLGGVSFGVLAVAIRILRGVNDFDLGTMFADPALYAVAISGIGGFYLFTVALQTGTVNGAAAGIVVGETVVPSVIGIVLLGDTTRSGWGWLTIIAFVAAVAGAVTVAMSKAVEAGAG